MRKVKKMNSTLTKEYQTRKKKIPKAGLKRGKKKVDKSARDRDPQTIQPSERPRDQGGTRGLGDTNTKNLMNGV